MIHRMTVFELNRNTWVVLQHQHHAAALRMLPSGIHHDGHAACPVSINLHKTTQILLTGIFLGGSVAPHRTCLSVLRMFVSINRYHTIPSQDLRDVDWIYIGDDDVYVRR